MNIGFFLILLIAVAIVFSMGFLLVETVLKMVRDENWNVGARAERHRPLRK
ncbi:hypothetical protein HTZ77_08620 [Nonomuraea sp. SMC257]|uniref:Uncharacterized protein n=1 Tax=Nonomuraea montanisoli TaxID=2741721 RepID=A0A7Y6M2G8_9ACTN|nr:hypothetical protein [Nonomuraea montanisoli]NUW31486.1 hypothetical protein [Nonomuraea montanisoli]